MINLNNGFRIIVTISFTVVLLFGKCEADPGSDLAEALQKYTQTVTNAIPPAQVPSQNQSDPDSQDEMDQPHPQPHTSTIRWFRYIVIPIASAIALVVVYVYRSFVRAKEAVAQRNFINHFKNFTHAKSLDDQFGLSYGRFKLDYPKLRVGEFVYNVKGSTYEGADILYLNSGKVIQFYVDEVLPEAKMVRKPFGTVQQTSVQVQKATLKAQVKKSIFD